MFRLRLRLVVKTFLTEMNKKFISAHLKAAEVYSELSSALRLKVGCVIVKNDTIIGIGYNGTPSGWDNDCENKVYPDKLLGDYEQHYDEFDAAFPLKDSEGRSYSIKTKDEVIHAEINAISKVAKSTNSSDGATMFVTHAPCIECAKALFQAGIRNVYYRDTYRDTRGVDFLNKCGVEIEQIK